MYVFVVVGNCTDLHLDYNCTCPVGFSGSDCQENINDCANFPCHNGACVDGIASYTCNCLNGYTGLLCETNIDDCVNSRCMNGATCLDGIADYTCQCVIGYKGNLCRINIDDCISGPCENGATCTDLVANYQCTCRHVTTCIANVNSWITDSCLIVLVILVATVKRMSMSVLVSHARMVPLAMMLWMDMAASVFWDLRVPSVRPILMIVFLEYVWITQHASITLPNTGVVLYDLHT